MSYTQKLWLGFGGTGLALATFAGVIAAHSNHESDPVVLAVVLPLISLSFLVAGLVAWTRRPENGTGRLLILVSFLQALNGFWEANDPALFTVGEAFGSLFLAAFIHLVLAFPEGRLETTLERRLIIPLYLAAFGAGIVPALFGSSQMDCTGCPNNEMTIFDSNRAATIAEDVFTILGIVIFLGVVALLGRRWQRASAAARRVLNPVYLSGAGALALIGLAFGLGTFSDTAGGVAGAAAFTLFGLVPLVFLAGLLRTRLYRASARLLREVPDHPTPEEIQDGFRRVLGDPRLTFLMWLDEIDSYVDIHGNPTELPWDTPTRVVTKIEYPDLKLGAIVHDPALWHQQAVLEDVVNAARIAMAKDRGLEALQRSETRSRALLDAIPDLMFRISRDGTYLEAKGDRSALARPEVELIGANVRDVLPPSVAEPFLRRLQTAADGGPESIEYRLDIGGQMRDFEARMVPSTEDEVLVIVRDFSERRRMEEELEERLARIEREQQFTRAVVNSAPVIFLLVDPDGKIVRFNDTTEELFGIVDDERVRGKYWWDVFLPPENRGGAQAYCRRMAEGQDDLRAEAEWQSATSERYTIAAFVRRVVDGDGNLRYLICGQDVTELIRQRDELRQQRDFLSSVGRATPSLLAIVYADGTVAEEGVNYSFRQLTGYDDPDMVGKRFWDLVIPPELVEEVKEAFDEQIVSGQSIEHETAWIGRSGEWRVVSWWVRPLGEDSGKHVVCGTDVTERNRQEAELRASRSRIVEAADDARRRLERNLHDGAQQRLVSISLALRLAQGKVRTDPGGADQLLAGAAEELTHALADLRELARGIHPAVLTDRGLEPALETLVQRAPVPVELNVELGERLPAPVEVAAYYVVAEALTNVAKYAEASAVQVRAERVNGRVVVEVSDDGRGGADPMTGSGLRGLADRLAAVEGRLEVDSPEGGGTQVRATIPVAG